MPHGAHSPRSWIPAALLLALALSLGTRAEADIILLVSEPSYAVGERVEFALVNGSEHVIAVSNTTWWKITDANGAVVGGCDAEPVELEVRPGNFLDSGWNQIDCTDHRPVPMGRYRLDAIYSSECCPGVTSIEAFFEIGTAAVAPTSWGRIKATFEGSPTLPRQGR
ncbi:MAG TPA: hypothetical protein VNM87_03270 [Candidatus Udaeobacter sp.]|nr:hypothetical protein [Candidatus Udaeobacter sp.]